MRLHHRCQTYINTLIATTHLRISSCWARYINPTMSDDESTESSADVSTACMVLCNILRAMCSPVPLYCYLRPVRQSLVDHFCTRDIGLRSLVPNRSITRLHAMRERVFTAHGWLFSRHRWLVLLGLPGDNLTHPASHSASIRGRYSTVVGV